MCAHACVYMCAIFIVINSVIIADNDNLANHACHTKIYIWYIMFVVIKIVLGSIAAMLEYRVASYN